MKMTILLTYFDQFLKIQGTLSLKFNYQDASSTAGIKPFTHYTFVILHRIWCDFF